MSATHTVTVVNLILYCPACGDQHVDAPNKVQGWFNPPHRSHLCHACGHIWRPADVETNGVIAIETRGKNDSPIAIAGAPFHDEAPLPWAVGEDGDVVDARGLPIFTIDQHRDRPDEIVIELARAIVRVVNRQR